MNKQADIAIIVVGFNRPKSLKRLLNSLEAADYSGYENIPLIICLDFSGNNDCNTVALEFEWKFGEKQVILQSENLGLKKHIFKCGDWAIKYDAIIMLEDDLVVSPAFYDYAQQFYFFYKDQLEIGGIGLYHYKFNEFSLCPFDPLEDGFDNYFAQVPCSWGQMWTREQWLLFKTFFETDHSISENIPNAVKLWPNESSWKKVFFNYLLQSNKTIVYPRISLTTNFGDPGNHYDRTVHVWQTPLLVQKKIATFSDLNSSCSVYDSHFELHPLVYNKIKSEKIDVGFDLNGSKNLADIKTEYLFSSKICKKPIRKIPIDLYPYELNILLEINSNVADDHNCISFGKTIDFVDQLNFDRKTIDFKRIFHYQSSLTIAGKNEILKSKEFQLGKLVLKPFRFLRKIIKS